MIDDHTVFVPISVILESGWVLHSIYHFAPASVAAALRGLAGLPTVTLDCAARVAQALDWMEAGMDFADALHLVGAEGCDRFTTCDAAMISAAQTVAAASAGQP